METFQGIAVAPGYAAGTALVFEATPVRFIDRTPLDRTRVEDEFNRFEVALSTSIQEIDRLRERVLADIGQAESSIFEAHLALLGDETFIQGVRRRISDDLVHADYAVEMEVAHLKHMLERTGNTYLRERTQDIEDLGRRLLKNLSRIDGTEQDVLSQLPPETILVAHQLLPSDTLNLDREHVKGIVTETGGAQSHAAILARSLAIPAVTGTQNITEHVKTGDKLLVDANAGTVTRSPTEAKTFSFFRDQKSYEQSLLEATQTHGICQTRCGTIIELHANIGRAEEAALVPTYGLNGVGLFRTEYLFLNAAQAPDLEEQAVVYRQVKQALGDRPLTLRTIDFGGDKHPMFLKWTVEENPNLGLRGLHFALAYPELFEAQLRAILRLPSPETLKIMFPMVIDIHDLIRAIETVKRIADEEQVESIPELGAMIETPAAIFQLDHILDLVDFISIGTNDLTQFILAADRDSTQMLAHYSTLHPAVMRAIRQIVERSQAKGRTCSICGEVAGDPGAACLLLGLGVRSLSMSPVLAPKVRQKIGNQFLKNLEEAAHQALRSTSTREVEMILSSLP